MDITEKIFWTVICAAGVLILPKLTDIINDKLKERLLKSNPKLVESQSWFFSDEKKEAVKLLILLMIFVCIAFVWITDMKFLV